jgi:hypothetical protein
MQLRRIRFASAAFALGLAVLPGLAAQARTLEVGADKEYKSLGAAAGAAQDGDRVVIAPGEYFDCAVWRANNLTIEGGGRPQDTVITDKTCMGKGLFVIVGANTTVRNLTLTRARVPDDNGAGIRLDGHDLTVEHVRFVNDQDGILGGTTGKILIRDSDFVRNGVCEQYCAHGIYTGDVELLRIENSRFSDTRQGHHIKSHALRTEIVNCDIADGPTGTASYLIDISVGGSLVVRDSRLEKGPNAENHTGAIVVGAEGVSHRTGEITIANNTFHFDGTYPTVFVLNRTATDAVLKGNTIIGPARPLHGDGSVE